MSNIVTTKMFGQQLNVGHWSTDGLVFLWRGIPAGNVVDESFYSHYGTITGATWQGQGLNFNDSLDVVNFGDVALFDLRLDSLTVEVWFTGNTTSGEVQGLVCKSKFAGADDRWAMAFGSGTIYAQVQLPGINTNSPISETAYIDGGLHQAVGVWDRAGDLVLHMDGSSAKGTPIDISSAAASDINSTYDVLIGSYNESTGIGPRANSNFHGEILSVRIWRRALSVGEILELYINPDLPMQEELPVWLGQAPVTGANPKGPLGHPLYGPFAGPIAC
ncbi:hypothetical protein LCGC14_2049590 [marine sediment metagenome]|uniref:LamG-like jellyroll fold domain-containing protein n=1 Tax=marine sediment metagenome TaxID=412755 RepID=A0A0F9EPC8_9ZZZZ